MVDLSGYALDKALEILKQQGIETVNVRLTAAPRLRQSEPEGQSRVIRQSIREDGTPELLVCNIQT